MLIWRVTQSGRANVAQQMRHIKEDLAYLADPIVLSLQPGEVSAKFKSRWNMFQRTAWHYLTGEDQLPQFGRFADLEYDLGALPHNPVLDGTLPWLWVAANVHWDKHQRVDSIRARNLRDWVRGAKPDLASMTLAEALVTADLWCLPSLRRRRLAGVNWDLT